MPFLGLLGVIIVHSVWSFVATGLAPVWLGPSIVAGSFFAFMGWMMFSGAPRTSERVPGLLAAGAELEARGAQVALVSPQSHEHTRELVKRFDVPFRFFVDRGGRAARSLGIFHEGGVPLGMPGYGADTVFPTVIVTDSEGRILLADQTDNYRVRPEPETFLAALDAASATVR